MEKENCEIQPSLFTSFMKRARNSDHVNSILREAKNRFGKLPWQLLASAVFVAAGKEVNDVTLAARILRQIPDEHVPSMHPATLSRMLITEKPPSRRTRRRL